MCVPCVCVCVCAVHVRVCVCVEKTDNDCIDYCDIVNSSQYSKRHIGVFDVCRSLCFFLYSACV